MPSPSPLFVTFEGIEGAGKTTQIRLLSRWLDARGVAHIVGREPGRTGVGEAIRAVLLDPRHRDIRPLTDLLLYNAARAQHLFEIIEPALATGKVVLCDRFKDATRAYQGYAGGLPQELLDAVHALPGLDREPDLTFLLDLPVQAGLGRARRREAEASERLGRFEALDLEFHHKVRDGYLDLARRHPDRIEVIDASGSVDDVQARLRERLSGRLQMES